MALIIAVNPGATQSATLARLARELQNCELIGADSYAIAIKAIEQRPPDLVLLPGTDALAEAELLRRLKAVPRSVPTLKLPPPMGLDVKGFAAEVRALLGGPAAAPAGPPPHLLAAATALVKWIRARKSTWREVPVVQTAAAAPQPSAFESAESNVPDDAALVARLREAAMSVERDRERQRELEAQEPSALERAAEAASELGESVTNWLPRIAALAVILAVVAAGVVFWPTIRDASSSLIGSFTAPNEEVVRTDAPAAPAATSQKPPAPAQGQAAETDSRVPGWIAVFAPFEVAINEGTTAVPLDDQGRAMLSPGPHKLRFRNQALGYDEVRTVQVRPTQTTTLNLLPKTMLGVTSNEPAEVLVDGTSIGRTPIARYRIDLGTHTVVVRSSGGEREFSVDATMKPIQLDVYFSRP